MAKNYMERIEALRQQYRGSREDLYRSRSGAVIVGECESGGRRGVGACVNPFG